MSVAATSGPVVVAGTRAPVKDRASQEFGELLGIARDAIAFFPPMYVASVFGQPWTWLPPHHRYSEFRILDVWQPLQSLSYLSAIAIPSIPSRPPTTGPGLLHGLFWRPSIVLQRPDHAGSVTSFPDEQWLFINGIMTTDAVAQLNAAFLADLFHRPITLVQNATSSVVSDLLECAFGKQWHRTTEAVVAAFPLIYDALAGPKSRVVVIAHSQGTIVAAVVLRLLAALTTAPRARSAGTRGGQPAGPVFVYPNDAPLDLSDFDPLSPDQLAKLEVYAFANCATTMRYWRTPHGHDRPIPWIESFGNEFDLVARLGMLAPRADEHHIAIDGPIFCRRGGWGHLLNEHYLAPIDAAQRRGRRRGGRGGLAPFELVPGATPSDVASSRLFAYVNGGVPDD